MLSEKDTFLSEDLKKFEELQETQTTEEKSE